MVNEPFSRSSRQKFTNFPVQVLSRCLLWDQPQDRLFDDIYFLFIFYLFSTLSLNTNLFIIPWSHDSILSTSIFCSFSVLGRNSSVNKHFNLPLLDPEMRRNGNARVETGIPFLTLPSSGWRQYLLLRDSKITRGSRLTVLFPTALALIWH